MMTRPPVFFDHLLALPLPVLVGFLLVYWGLFAVLVHRLLVPWIAGAAGQKLGRLEAEVPAQIGLAFGLLISFIAIPVWEQHKQAEEMARTEAAAYRDMKEAAESSGDPDAVAILPLLRGVLDYLVTAEWPKMARLQSPRIAALPLRELHVAIRGLQEGQLRSELDELFRQAADARQTRLRIAAYRPPPARWSIVGVLAMLTLLGVGLIHAESYRARRIALGMVAIGVCCCFVILLAYTRPYLGQFAIQPDDLIVLREECAADGIAPSAGDAAPLAGPVSAPRPRDW